MAKASKTVKSAKLSRQQKANRIKAAQERERRAQEKAAAQERTKKIFTIVVCVILVLALGIPVMAISLMSGH